MHGLFTSAGRADRPYIYEVTLPSTGKSFTAAQVTARQPLKASKGRDRFTAADASEPLGPICYMAMVSLALPQPHSRGTSIQEVSVQTRFASMLAQRAPGDWPPSPLVDMKSIVAVVGDDLVGTFPIVEMRKVDMSGWNAGRPHSERRELILYRLLGPLPTRNADGTSNGLGANAHALVHAYEADRK